MTKTRLEQLIAVLIAMVRRAARELDPRTAKALLADLTLLLEEYGWKA